MGVDDTVVRTARAAAQRLAVDLGDQLPGDVEAALHALDGAPMAERYVDPISLAGLVVSVATFAWTVYRDLQNETASPAREIVERRVRVQVRETDASAPPRQQDRIIEVVVAEVMRSREP